MGYTTDFYGAFEVTPPLSPEHAAYLKAFANTRRMRRNAEVTATYPDPIREAVGLPVGPDGAFYVAGGEGVVEPEPDDGKVRGLNTTFKGQAHTGDVVEYNEPPGLPSMEPGEMGTFSERYARFEKAREAAIEAGGQPGLWCQWVPSEDGTQIIWDGGEKFYEYVPWLRYLIHNFLAPWGYTLSGEVEWQGEEHGDVGKIVVADNKVRVARAVVSWTDE